MESVLKTERQAETAEENESTNGNAQTKLEDFLNKYKVANAVATAEVMYEHGATLEHLMEWREKDIEDICKEINVEVIIRADILKVLRKIPESQVYKDNEAKNRVIYLDVDDRDKMDNIDQKLKYITKEMEKIRLEMIELESNSKLSKQKVNESCQLIISSIEKHRQYLFDKIDIYVNQKKELLNQQLEKLRHFQQLFNNKNEQINQCINDSDLENNQKAEKLQQLLNDNIISDNNYQLDWNDDNEKEMDSNVNVKFANDAKETEKLVGMIDQILKEQMVFVETGSIALSNVIIKERSIISDNPLISVNYLIKNIEKGWKSVCTYELEIATFNDNKNLQQWKIIKQIPGKRYSFNETIDFGNEKDNLLEWDKKYSLRMRASFCQGISFTSFSNIFIFDTSIPIKFGSVILTKEENRLLLSYLPKGKESKVTLLYRGSRDGFRASDFHEKCDNKGATVTIVLSDQFNHVFGGFTNVQWTSRNTYANDAGAFVYLLRSGKGDNPQKFTIKSGHEQHAIYDSSLRGPVFDNGCDPYSYNGPSDNTKLGGARNFQVKEIEVYLVG
ncbi:TLDc domain-containing protein [Reticulomyxa filosa]|uniref:TLDc domain-containing protein n=1 Tax=Reticulomyxa filosa TaxID=46433 RepID=X6LJD7_RETFI|nr:TLDc domain-containing protein [Reticulomyxa filosa]|eukprot:ETO01461.1 TLDc domain-containing protein [Reticulomyxa filosa]